MPLYVITIMLASIVPGFKDVPQQILQATRRICIAVIILTVCAYITIVITDYIKKQGLIRVLLEILLLIIGSEARTHLTNLSFASRLLHATVGRSRFLVKKYFVQINAFMISQIKTTLKSLFPSPKIISSNYQLLKYIYKNCYYHPSSPNPLIFGFYFEHFSNLHLLNYKLY